MQALDVREHCFEAAGVSVDYITATHWVGDDNLQYSISVLFEQLERLCQILDDIQAQA